VQIIARALRSREIPGVVELTQTPGGLVQVDVRSPLATARLYVDGGHVAQFQPAGGAPVLFLSRQSHFTPGKPIRGGVPVCFPWFGPKAGEPDAPMHGFARTMDWTLASTAQNPDGSVTLVLALESSDYTRARWPHDFRLRHRVTVGAELSLALEVENPSAAPITYEAALHTYLAVADVRQAAITGLEGASYLDKTDGFKLKTLGPAPLRLEGETDRVFPNHRGPCTLDDRAAGRRITIETSGSATTVVWNPWIAKATAMPDFGDDEWPHMLCIETANTGENAVTLAPGATHEMTAIVRAASLR
jgi:D-hexose-6-phosphate mutarotase